MMPNEHQSNSSSEEKRRKAACALSGKEHAKHDLVFLEALRLNLAERIRQDFPDLPPDALVSKAELARYRTLYVEELLKAERGDLTVLDQQVAKSLATHETLAENIEAEFLKSSERLVKDCPTISQASAAAGRSSSRFLSFC